MLLAGQSRRGEQRLQADFVRSAAQQLQPQLGDDPIFADQRYDVGERTNGGHLQEGRQPFLAPVSGAECLHQLQGNPDAREVLVRIAAIVPLRIDDRDGGWKRRTGLVMVGDDQIDAQLTSPDGRLHPANPAVHRDAQLHAVLVQPIDRGWLQAIAVAQAVGNEVTNVSAEQLECAAKNDCGGDAVDVVVAVDGDALVIRQRLADARDRFRQSGEPRGRVQVIQGGLEKARGIVRIGEAALAQQVGDDGLEPERTSEPVGGRLIDRRVLPDWGHHRQVARSEPKSRPRRPICLNF